MDSSHASSPSVPSPKFVSSIHPDSPRVSSKRSTEVSSGDRPSKSTRFHIGQSSTLAQNENNSDMDLDNSLNVELDASMELSPINATLEGFEEYL